MSAASGIQYKIAYHHLRGHADQQARPSRDVLALSRLAAVFNSVILSFSVVGVVNYKLRTVRACRFPDRGRSAPRAHRPCFQAPVTGTATRQAGIYVSAAITCGRASHLKPQAKQASRSIGR